MFSFRIRSARPRKFLKGMAKKKKKKIISRFPIWHLGRGGGKKKKKGSQFAGIGTDPDFPINITSPLIIS